jgi:hypothetical protein
MTKENLEVACPNCGSTNTYGVTRVVGYFSRINNWNNQKVGELKDRQQGVYGVRDEQIAALEIKYDDGLYQIGKEHCSMCAGEEKIIEQAMKRSGLEGKVPVYLRKITDDAGDIVPKNLALAAKMQVPLSSLPAVAIVKDGRIVFMEATTYENGSPARMITPNALKDQLQKYFN